MSDGDSHRNEAMWTIPCCETIRRCGTSRLLCYLMCLIVIVSSAMYVLVRYSLAVKPFPTIYFYVVVIAIGLMIWLFKSICCPCFEIMFPIACGYSGGKCFFTGKSSRSLQDILLNIQDIALFNQQLIKVTREVFPRLNDLKTELENQITPPTTFEIILSGSIAERYGVPYSFGNRNPLELADVDAMFCFQSFEGSFSETTSLLVEPLIPSGVGFLGFAQLKFITTESILSSNDVIRQAQRIIGSTTLASPYRYSFGVSAMVTRPAIKISSYFEADVTLCIKCSEWPPPSDWPTRQRSWPSQDDVMRIASLGCHLVPKPAPSDKEKTSWRFSFSLAEVELSKLVPNTARKCFLALKIILKNHLQPVFQIASYHLKTIFLNTLERTPTNLWVDENIEQCFFILLKELHDALLHRHLLHHWFRSINLLANIENPRGLQVLIRKLQRIGENPAPFIFDDGCFCLIPCCTRLHLYDFPGQTRSDYYDEVVQVVHDNEQVANDRTDQDASCNSRSAPTVSASSRYVDERPSSHDETCTVPVDLVKVLKVDVRIHQNPSALTETPLSLHVDKSQTSYDETVPLLTIKKNTNTVLH